LGFAIPLQAHRPTDAESDSLALRTGDSPPVALHPASRQRGYVRLRTGERLSGGDLHPTSHAPLKAHRGTPPRARRYASGRASPMLAIADRSLVRPRGTAALQPSDLHRAPRPSGPYVRIPIVGAGPAPARIPRSARSAAAPSAAVIDPDPARGSRGGRMPRHAFARPPHRAPRRARLRARLGLRRRRLGLEPARQRLSDHWPDRGLLRPALRGRGSPRTRARARRSGARPLRLRAQERSVSPLALARALPARRARGDRRAGARRGARRRDAHLRRLTHRHGVHELVGRRRAPRQARRRARRRRALVHGVLRRHAALFLGARAICCATASTSPPPTPSW
jgi:hypothetical protein